jgi:hypothetical protein
MLSPTTSTHNVHIGACDGNGDKTIKKLYIPNEHWRGVFVEPMSINVRDLIKYMADHNIAHRWETN